MDADIDFHHIARLQDKLLLSGIGRVMRDAVIQRKSRREPHPRHQGTSTLKARIIEQRSHAILDIHSYISEVLPRPHVVLRILSDPAVNFRCFTVVIQPFVVLDLTTRLVPRFLGRCTSRGLNNGLIVLDLPTGVPTIWEYLMERNSRRRWLLPSLRFPLRLLPLLLALGGSGRRCRLRIQ